MSGGRDEDYGTMDGAIAARAPYGIGSEPTYSGVLSMFRRRYTKTVEGADVVISGVPFDQSVTNRPGTRFGPRALRAASTQLAWVGGPWRWPFDPFAELDVVDAGDCLFDHARPAEFPATLKAHADRLLASGGRLLTLGGDHFCTYPLLKAHAERHGPLALVQFDAHSDTWRDDVVRDGVRGVNHGTMFYHAVSEGIVDPARSVQVGIRTGNPESHGLTVLDADFVHEHSPAAVAERIASVVGAGPAYLTFDIDCLDPAFAPGTGTPVCGGLSSWQAEKILCGLGAIDFVGMDVVEVSPPYDVAEVTALAGATMALNMIGLWAAQGRGRRRQ